MTSKFVRPQLFKSLDSLSKLSTLIYNYTSYRVRKKYDLFKIQGYLNVASVLLVVFLLFGVQFVFSTTNLRVKYFYKSPLVSRNLNSLLRGPVLKRIQLYKIQYVIENHEGDYQCLRKKLTDCCKRYYVAPSTENYVLDLVDQVYKQYFHRDCRTGDYFGQYLTKGVLDIETNQGWFQRWSPVKPAGVLSYLLYLLEILFSITKPLFKLIFVSNEKIFRIWYTILGGILLYETSVFELNYTKSFFEAKAWTAEAFEASNFLQIPFLLSLSVFKFVFYCSNTFFLGYLRALREYLEKIGVVITRKQKEGRMFLDYYSSIKFKDKINKLMLLTTRGPSSYLKMFNVEKEKFVTLGGFQHRYSENSKNVQSEILYAILTLRSITYIANLLRVMYSSSLDLVNEVTQMETSYMASIQWTSRGYKRYQLLIALTISYTLTSILTKLPSYFVFSLLYGDFVSPVAFFSAPFTLITSWWLLKGSLDSQSKQQMESRCYQYTLYRFLCCYLLVPLFIELINFRFTLPQVVYYFLGWEIYRSPVTYRLNSFIIEKYLVYTLDYVLYELLPSCLCYSDVLYCM